MKKFVIIVLIIIVVIFGGCFLSYKNGLKSVSNDTTDIDFNVKEGSNFYSIAPELKKAGLIKSELCYKIYIKIHRISKIHSGVFILNKTMTVKEITEKLQEKSKDPNAIYITFKEGYNMKDIIKAIVSTTNNSKEDILTILNDQDYLNSLIIKYWFIDEEVLNKNLYYSLEGYLYPNTYEFSNKDVSPEHIFNVMINQMGKKLEPYKKDILDSKYSVHQLLTLASIVELEGTNKEDRDLIAGVFYNRLKANMNLGSDVTAYYGAQVNMNERDLLSQELVANNSYNTRNVSMMGKLPVGPVSNPSIDSIQSVIYPKHSDYYYFVADRNHKTYFAVTATEHSKNIEKLKREGLWYTY